MVRRDAFSPTDTRLVDSPEAANRTGEQDATVTNNSRDAFPDSFYYRAIRSKIGEALRLDSSPRNRLLIEYWRRPKHLDINMKAGWPHAERRKQRPEASWRGGGVEGGPAAAKERKLAGRAETGS
jgi:hypothetical protein